MLCVWWWSDAGPGRRAGSGVGKYCTARNRTAKGSTILRRLSTLPIYIYYLSMPTTIRESMIMTTFACSSYRLLSLCLRSKASKYDMHIIALIMTSHTFYFETRNKKVGLISLIRMQPFRGLK